jgi:hypothetical protein
MEGSQAASAVETAALQLGQPTSEGDGLLRGALGGVLDAPSLTSVARRGVRGRSFAYVLSVSTPLGLLN